MWKLGFLARRLAALIYDALLTTVVLFAATAALLPFNGGEAVASGDFVYSAYLFLVTFAFVGWSWTHGGQTLGMKAWRLRVIRGDGQPLGWSDALIRFAAGAASLALLGLGFVWILLDREGKAWHDRWSRTEILRVSTRH